MPETLQTIGSYAFADCDAFTQIAIPSGVTVIENGIFNGCQNLKEVNFHDTVSSIGNNAFSGCVSLEEITLPANLETIGSYAFSNCDSFAQVTIPSGVTVIEMGAFGNCDHLASVNLPDGLTQISSNAFSGCTELTDLILPEGLQVLAYSAFSNCDSLTEVTIPSGITIIASSLFSSCENLTRVTLHNAVTQISSSAFYDCSSLTDITLPDSLQILGSNAFSQCDSLTQITIPSEVTTIGSGAFSYCDQLNTVLLPDGLKIIEHNTFRNSPFLTNVILPDGLESIGTYAFADCNSLTEITIPDGICAIADGLFSGCSNLSKISLPEEITDIGNYAFEKCTSLLSFELPNGLETLGHSAFSNCDRFVEIVIPDGVMVIESSTFSNCDNLVRVELPEQLCTIGSGAFSNCVSLTQMIIPSGVTKIESSTFLNCEMLKELELPENLTSIGTSAFSGCRSLTDITIPDGVTRIESSTFYNCENLTSVILLDTISHISEYAFHGCKNLTIVAVKDSYAWKYAEANGIHVVNIDDGLRVLQLVVKDDKQEHIISGYTVNWYKAGEQSIIATGTVLRDMEKGVYEYELILDESLYLDYIQPMRTKVEYTGGTLKVVQILESIVDVIVSGTINNGQGSPVRNAMISFTQVFGTTEKKYFVQTAADGSYSIALPSVPTSGIISADGYYDRQMSVNLNSTMEAYSFSAEMRPLPESKITLKLPCKNAGSGSYHGLSYENVNLAFRVENLTQGTMISDFVFQKDNLVIPDSQIFPNDILQITATDLDGQMTAEPVTVALDAQKNGSWELRFVENGKFTIEELTGIGGKLLMVFDDTGTFVYSENVSSNYTSPGLTAGEYTIVLMQKTELLRTAGKLEDLKTYGLTAGMDYVSKRVTIENGIIAVIKNAFVPALDDNKLSYLVADNTFFTVNHSLAFAEEYVVLRISYELDEKYTTSSQKVRIILPKEMEMAGGSLTLDGKKTIYSLENHVLTVNTNQREGVIRFYVSADSVGDYQIQSELLFAIGSDPMIQPLGSADLKVVAAQLELPDRTCGGVVTVTGKAVPNSTITFYDTGVEIGSTTSNGAGSFKMELPLKLAGKYTFHEISAEVCNDHHGDPLAVESKILINDENHVQLSKITMINIAHDNQGLDSVEYVSEFDFIHPGPAPNYWFWPGKFPEFTFIVEFVGNGASMVENVHVVTMSNEGEQIQIKCFYDEANNRWLGTHAYHSASDAPVGVKATYDIIYSGKDENSVPQLDTELLDAYKEELENVLGSEKEAMPDWDEVMSQVQVDPDAEFTQEDEAELEQLAKELEASAKEMDRLLEEFYYQEQTAWAEQGVTYTRDGDTQILELDTGKVEVTTKELPNMTPKQLLDDGYVLAGDSNPGSGHFEPSRRYGLR